MLSVCRHGTANLCLLGTITRSMIVRPHLRCDRSGFIILYRNNKQPISCGAQLAATKIGGMSGECAGIFQRANVWRGSKFSG